MLPRWHVLLGFVFAYVAYWFSPITIFEATLIFLSSFLIDVDHYIWYGFKKKDWNLKNSYIYLKKHRNIIKPLMLFHTIEFHILVGLFSFFWIGFLYIFIGMVFHSIIDLMSMIYEGNLYTREFWLTKFIF